MNIPVDDVRGELFKFINGVLDSSEAECGDVIFGLDVLGYPVVYVVLSMNPDVKFLDDIIYDYLQSMNLEPAWQDAQVVVVIEV